MVVRGPLRTVRDGRRLSLMLTMDHGGAPVSLVDQEHKKSNKYLLIGHLFMVLRRATSVTRSLSGVGRSALATVRLRQTYKYWLYSIKYTTFEECAMRVATKKL